MPPCCLHVLTYSERKGKRNAIIGVFFFLFLLLPCFPPSLMLPLRLNKNTLAARGGGIYLHFHAMLFHASLCFEVNMSVSCVWHPLFPHSSLHHPSLPRPPPSPALISLLPCVDYLWRFVSLPPFILHTFTRKTLIFTPHALLPHALLSLPSSLK